MRNLLWLVALCLACGCADKNAIDNAKWAVQQRFPMLHGSPNFSGMFVVHGTMTNAGAPALATCGYVDTQGTTGTHPSVVRFMVDQSESHALKTAWPRIVAIESPHIRMATVRSANSATKATVFEEAYWNPSCVDATHPPSYTGQ